MGDTVRTGGTLTMLGVVPTASCPPAPPRLPPAVDGTGDLAGRKRAVAGRAGMGGPIAAVSGQRFPLGRAADSHAAIESRATVGKTLLVT